MLNAAVGSSKRHKQCYVLQVISERFEVVVQDDKALYKYHIIKATPTIVEEAFIFYV